MLTTEWGNDWECLPPSCRDKGWTWRRVGALCLSWWHDEWSGFGEANRSHPHEDKHKAQYISLKALPRAAQRREDQAGRQNRETAPQAQRAQVEVSGASWVCTCCRPA